MNDISELGDNFRILSKDQYRIFIKYFDKNYRELYELKETYEVHKIGDNFKVKSKYYGNTRRNSLLG